MCVLDKYANLPAAIGTVKNHNYCNILTPVVTLSACSESLPSQHVPLYTLMCSVHIAQTVFFAALCRFVWKLTSQAPGSTSRTKLPGNPSDGIGLQCSGHRRPAATAALSTVVSCPIIDRFLDTSGGCYRLTASFKCRFQRGF